MSSRRPAPFRPLTIASAALAAALSLSPGAAGATAQGRCVPIFSDDAWRPVITGSGYGRAVTRPATSPPWGSVIPNTRAQWVYVDSFNTGRARSPVETRVRRFTKSLGSQLQRPYNLESAYLRVTADNGYVLYVTGTRVGGTYDTVNRRYRPTADWRQYQTYNILPALRTGNNTVTIDVYDHGVAAGFLLDGQVCAKRGYSQAVPTGSAGP